MYLDQTPLPHTRVWGLVLTVWSVRPTCNGLETMEFKQIFKFLLTLDRLPWNRNDALFYKVRDFHQELKQCLEACERPEGCVCVSPGAHSRVSHPDAWVTFCTRKKVHRGARMGFMFLLKVHSQFSFQTLALNVTAESHWCLHKKLILSNSLFNDLL